MVTTATETELKYEAPDEVALPGAAELDQLPAVAGIREGAAEELVAQYFDTADLRLIRAGITLRRRVGGHDEGWHLKMPAGPHTRREIRLPLGDGNLKVPAELAERVLVYTRTKPLRPAAVITTLRTRLLLLGEGGDELAELAVDQVHAKPANGAGESWREVELELAGGDAALLDAADRLLRRSGLTQAKNTAKFERAMGIQPAGQRGSGQAELAPESPAAEVVLAYLREQVGAIKSLDPAVRASEPDSVHQLRITIRRIRAVLDAFGPVIWRADVGPLSEELRWLGNLLGAARDAEVLAARLRRALDDTSAELVIGPVAARVQAHFAPVAASAQAAASKALSGGRYFALLDQLDELFAESALATGATRPASEVLRQAVRKAYRRTRRRAHLARHATPGHDRDVAVHQVRKATKRARYAAEVLAPAMGKPASRFARQMKRLQSQLGDFQDSVIARRTERELGIAAAVAGENAFTYGILYQRDVAEGRHAAGLAEQTWAKATRPKYVSWLS
ncbi:MAG TPA: CYTH and CHAD domain-containing protein [Streptosporangiaceae bacterium]|nr:CYTH and CHAD domain-containing protein [Streptosporangiaceae bacterium]